MSVCPNDTTDCTGDAAWQKNFSITTSLSFSRRKANTFYNLTNSALVNVQDLSAASPQPLDYFFGNGNLNTSDISQGWMNAYILAYIGDPNAAGEIRLAVRFTDSSSLIVSTKRLDAGL